MKKFSKGLVRAIGGWLDTGNAADQIGHLVIKPVCQDGVRVLGNGIADYSGLGDARQSGGLSQPCFSSSVKANALHAHSVSRVWRKMYYTKSRTASKSKVEITTWLKPL